MRQILVISDGTGRTGELVSRAALEQFRGSEVRIERAGDVRTPEDVEQALARASASRSVVLYTLVGPELSRLVQDRGRELGVPVVDVLGPVLVRLSEYLAMSPEAKPGRLHEFDSEYLRRIEALEFAVKHDDGLGAATADQADIVLVGVSRASKTPTSVYLSYHGWKVANFPLVTGVEPPAVLDHIASGRVVGLTVDRHVLQAVRRHRQGTLGPEAAPGYADLEALSRELVEARRLCDRRGWAVVDVTHRSVEEIAAEVVRIVAKASSGRNGAPGAGRRR